MGDREYALVSPGYVVDTPLAGRCYHHLACLPILCDSTMFEIIFNQALSALFQQYWLEKNTPYWALSGASSINIFRDRIFFCLRVFRRFNQGRWCLIGCRSRLNERRLALPTRKIQLIIVSGFDKSRWWHLCTRRNGCVAVRDHDDTCFVWIVMRDWAHHFYFFLRGSKIQGLPKYMY